MWCQDRVGWGKGLHVSKEKGNIKKGGWKKKGGGDTPFHTMILKNYPVSEDVLNEQWEASKYETSCKELNHQKSKLIYSRLKARGW